MFEADVLAAAALLPTAAAAVAFEQDSALLGVAFAVESTLAPSASPSAAPSIRSPPPPRSVAAAAAAVWWPVAAAALAAGAAAVFAAVRRRRRRRSARVTPAKAADGGGFSLEPQLRGNKIELVRVPGHAGPPAPDVSPPLLASAGAEADADEAGGAWAKRTAVGAYLGSCGGDDDDDFDDIFAIHDESGIGENENPLLRAADAPRPRERSSGSLAFGRADATAGASYRRLATL